MVSVSSESRSTVGSGPSWARGIIREYVQAKITGALAWDAVDSFYPSGNHAENNQNLRGGALAAPQHQSCNVVTQSSCVCNFCYRDRVRTGLADNPRGRGGGDRRRRTAARLVLLHLVFGDSSVGEVYSDVVCLLGGALVAFTIVKGLGYPWQTAMACIVIEGLLALLDRQLTGVQLLADDFQLRGSFIALFLPVLLCLHQALILLGQVQTLIDQLSR